MGNCFQWLRLRSYGVSVVDPGDVFYATVTRDAAAARAGVRAVLTMMVATNSTAAVPRTVIDALAARDNILGHLVAQRHIDMRAATAEKQADQIQRMADLREALGPGEASADAFNESSAQLTASASNQLNRTDMLGTMAPLDAASQGPDTGDVHAQLSAYLGIPSTAAPVGVDLLRHEPDRSTITFTREEEMLIAATTYPPTRPAPLTFADVPDVPVTERLLPAEEDDSRRVETIEA
jgi:hypothetical protein